MFGATQTQEKSAARAKCDYRPSLLALSCNSLGMMQSRHLIADADTLFVISLKV